MKRTKVEAAIKRHGSVAKLAQYMGYSRQAVYDWRWRGLEYMPRLAQLEYWERQRKEDSKVS